MATLTSPHDLTMKFLESSVRFGASFIFSNLAYEQIGLLRYRISGMESADAISLKYAAARREADELKRMADIALGIENKLRVMKPRANMCVGKKKSKLHVATDAADALDGPAADDGDQSSDETTDNDEYGGDGGRWPW